MKDSGIAWVNKIPSDWDIHPLYYYFAERNRPNRRGKENNLLSLSYGKIIKKDINTCEGLLPASYNSYNIIDPLDIVLRLTDLQNDKRSLRTGLSHERGIITSAYVTLKPSKRVCPAFFHYLLHAYDVEKVLYNMGNGVRQSLNYAELSKLPLLEPSLQEQQQIAGYLDKKCAEIDTLSQNIQKQIEALEQYKRAVITETVTKGLNPSAPMKDSGIPWIGQIPAHWNIVQLNKLCSLQTGGTPQHSEGIVTENTGIAWYTPRDFTDNSIKLKTPSQYIQPEIITKNKILLFPINSVLFVSIASIGKVGVVKNKSYANQQITALIPTVQICGQFLSYVLLTASTYIQKTALYTVMAIVNNQTLGQYKIMVPPASEQQDIAEYLDKKCAKIDGLIQDKQQQLEKLEQYKKATIFEYVTGKKQVPEV